MKGWEGGGSKEGGEEVDEHSEGGEEGEEVNEHSGGGKKRVRR